MRDYPTLHLDIDVNENERLSNITLDIDVNENERLSNITLRHRCK